MAGCEQACTAGSALTLALLQGSPHVRELLLPAHAELPSSCNSNTWLAGAPANAAQLSTLADVMRPQFEFVDANKDGMVTMTELKQLSTQASAPQLPQQLPEMSQHRPTMPGLGCPITSATCTGTVA